MSSYATLDDQDPLLYLQLGDGKAFSEIYRRYWEKLVAIGYFHTRDRQMTEEVGGDAMIGLWNRRQDPGIRSLPARLGTAVKYEDQVSVGGIAERMELSAKSVEYHIARALKTLKNYIREFSNIFPF